MRLSFDAIIIGAGQAGPSLAARLTQAGWTVALIEMSMVGGTCVNVGCTPTKAMVASAKVAHTVANAHDFGVLNDSAVTVDLAKVKARKDRIVLDSRTKGEAWIKSMQGCTLIYGLAEFESATCVRVGEQSLTSKHIFLNVGARPRIPDMPGIETVPYLTSSTILDLETLPEHLIIVGGSYVGLEFAQMFRRFGSRVTVVERGPTLLGHEDDDICEAAKETLESEGIQFRLGAECIHLANSGADIAVHVSCSAGDPEIHGSHVLLAIGRDPNTDNLLLDRAGLVLDTNGFIPVNDRLETAVSGIWALGDCNGRGGFTHTAYNDYEIVAANLLDGDDRKVSDRIPAHALFIDPPLAQVGMNEKAVRALGKPALVGIRPMTRVNRAIEKGETRGLMKVLVDASSQQILGATLFGVGGDEAIHCILTAMYAKQSASLIARSVHIHPTVAELIPTIFQELRPLA